MIAVWNALSAILVFFGALLILVSMIGTVRLPDVFCRAHALSKGMTLGLGLLLAGLWVDLRLPDAGLKVVAAILFQFITLPVASHLLARLSFQKRLPRAGDTRIDEDNRQR
ncbi:MAG TPA: monovalent cation/H(+) antiporter subunit G [Opitutaceae bacterium]